MYIVLYWITQPNEHRYGELTPIIETRHCQGMRKWIEQQSLCVQGNECHGTWV